MLPSLAEFGVDLVIVKHDDAPRGAATTKRIDARTWIEDGVLFVRDSKGTPRVVADDVGDEVARITSHDEYVCVQVQSFEVTRLFRRTRATLREIEMPDFGMPVIDAAIVDDLLVVRLFSGPTGDEPPDELNAMVDRMQLVIVGYDLRKNEDRWQWEYPFDAGLLEPCRFTGTHVFATNDSTGAVWSVRVRDGQVRAIDDPLIDGTGGAGSIFWRSSTGFAWWNAERSKIEAVIVMDGETYLSAFELGDNRLLVHSRTVTTLLQKRPRRVLAAHSHDPIVCLEIAEPDNDRWKVVFTSHNSPELRPATAAQAARWEKPIERSEVSDNELARAVERAKVRVERAMVDEARWRAISRIVEEEGAAIKSARARLVARELISAEHDPTAIAVWTGSDPGQRFRWWNRIADEDLSARLLWATLAHDEPHVRAAFAAVQEFSQRMQRVGLDRSHFALEFATASVDDAWMNGPWPGPAARMLSDVLNTSGRGLHVVSVSEDPSGFLQRAHALWQIAARRGLVVPPGYNAALTGTAFDELRSPFEPLLALSRLGYPLQKISDRAVLLSLPCFTALHEPTREDARA